MHGQFDYRLASASPGHFKTAEYLETRMRNLEAITSRLEATESSEVAFLSAQFPGSLVVHCIQWVEGTRVDDDEIYD